MEKYQKITDITIDGAGEKLWVKVTFENGSQWLPALADLGKILAFIGQCEDIKYPNGKGYLMTKEFVSECFNKNEAELFQIYQKYKLI